MLELGGGAKQFGRGRIAPGLKVIQCRLPGRKCPCFVKQQSVDVRKSLKSLATLD